MLFVTNKKMILVILMTMVFPVFVSFHAYGQDKPLLAVLDLDHSGISKREATLLTDIITMNIMETGTFHLISRPERTNLLNAHGFPLKESKIANYYPEIASLIYADYIVGGIIKKEKKTVTIALHLYEKESQHIIKAEEKDYISLEEGMNNMREFVKELLSGVSYKVSSEDFSQKVINSLAPVPIKERILFLFHKNHTTPDWARIKTLIYILINHLTENPGYLTFFTEIEKDEGFLTKEDLQILAGRKQCQTIVLCSEEEEVFFLTLYESDGVEKLRVPLSRDFDPGEKAKEIIVKVTALAHISQESLIKEI
ncbi:MAG: hypothetical protein JXJ04_07470, partial [Spirochaetales bacterium]|nr:hypothetical protein [Spirochaetales bacterium]